MAGAFQGVGARCSGHRRQAFEGDICPAGPRRSSNSLAPGRLTSLCGTPSRRTSSDSLSGTTIDLPDDELAAEEGAPAAHQGHKFPHAPRLDPLRRRWRGLRRRKELTSYQVRRG